LANQKSKGKLLLVKRDGERDIVFTGTLIGEGESGDDKALIFRTESGKFVASLITGSYNGKHYGVVGETAAEIAAFYTREVTDGAGKGRVTRTHLNEAGKLAMQGASDGDDTFRDLGYEIVE
jgi:hypothetical protein